MRPGTAGGGSFRRQARVWSISTVLLLVLIMVVSGGVAAAAPGPASPEELSPQAGEIGIVTPTRDPRLMSSVATGELLVKMQVLTPPEGVGPQSFVARISGPDGIIEVVGSGEGTLVTALSPGLYSLVGQQGPVDLAFIQTSNSPVIIPSGGRATLQIINAVPATSSVSTEPVAVPKDAAIVPGSAIPVPTVINAGGGGTGVRGATRTDGQVLCSGAVRMQVTAGLFLAAVLAMVTARRTWESEEDRD